MNVSFPLAEPFDVFNLFLSTSAKLFSVRSLNVQNQGVTKRFSDFYYSTKVISKQDIFNLMELLQSVKPWSSHLESSFWYHHFHSMIFDDNPKLDLSSIYSDSQDDWSYDSESRDDWHSENWVDNSVLLDEKNSTLAFSIYRF